MVQERDIAAAIWTAMSIVETMSSDADHIANAPVNGARMSVHLFDKRRWMRHAKAAEVVGEGAYEMHQDERPLRWARGVRDTASVPLECDHFEVALSMQCANATHSSIALAWRLYEYQMQLCGSLDEQDILVVTWRF
jgi:hypothetical protein